MFTLKFFQLLTSELGRWRDIGCLSKNHQEEVQHALSHSCMWPHMLMGHDKDSLSQGVSNLALFTFWVR